MTSGANEYFLPTGDELDTINVLCVLAIFLSNALSVLYILWTVLPWMKPIQLPQPTTSVLEDSISVSTSPTDALG